MYRFSLPLYTEVKFDCIISSNFLWAISTIHSTFTFLFYSIAPFTNPRSLSSSIENLLMISKVLLSCRNRGPRFTSFNTLAVGSLVILYSSLMTVQLADFLWSLLFSKVFEWQMMFSLSF